MQYHGIAPGATGSAGLHHSPERGGYGLVSAGESSVADQGAGQLPCL
jgi:hypothetical protein